MTPLVCRDCVKKKVDEYFFSIILPIFTGQKRKNIVLLTKFDLYEAAHKTILVGLMDFHFEIFKHTNNGSDVLFWLDLATLQKSRIFQCAILVTNF